MKIQKINDEQPAENYPFRGIVEVFYSLEVCMVFQDSQDLKFSLT